MINMDVMRALNSRNKNLQVDVQIITLTDNLDHPYFSLIELSKANTSPVGIAKMEAPYTPYISNYWIKYRGAVVISFNMADLKPINTNASNFFNYVNQTEKNKFITRMKNQKQESKSDSEEYKNMTQRLQNDHYNYSFIGKVSRFKQKGNKFVVYFEDVGWKFLQKVPKEFRSTYVAGQYLDDTFQAICEFLDVHFAYSIEDLHEYTFATDGYSVQKDGQTVEDVETVLSEWGAKTSEEENKTDELDDPSNENPELVNLDKANENNENYVKTDPNNTQNNADTKLEEDTESEDDTQTVQDKIDKYQEDFDKKILDLFIGNSYYDSDLISPNLDYNKITITPKLINNDTSSTMSNVSMDANGDGTVTEDEARAFSQNLLNSGQTAIGMKGISFINNNNNGGGGKVALSYDQVNSLDFYQAKIAAERTDKYYWTTILRLRARGAFYTVGPDTPYYKFNY